MEVLGSVHTWSHDQFTSCEDEKYSKFRQPLNLMFLLSF